MCNKIYATIECATGKEIRVFYVPRMLIRLFLGDAKEYRQFRTTNNYRNFLGLGLLQRLAHLHVGHFQISVHYRDQFLLPRPMVFAS